MPDFIPKVPPLFQTQLAYPFAPNDATFTIADDAMLNDVPLSGLVGVSIDIGQPNPEYVVGTLADRVITVLIRNADPLRPNVAGAMPANTHRRGASVKITDFVSIGIMRNILNGDQSLNNILKYTQEQTFVDPLSLIDKQYADTLFTGGTIPPNFGNPVSGNSGSTEVTSETISVTTTGTNRYLIVQVSIEATRTVSTMTYNGVALTLIGAKTQGGLRCELWGLVAPTLGTHNVVITLSGLSVIAWNIVPCSSIDQSTPFSLGSTNGGSGVSSTGADTTTVPNSILVQAITTQSPNIVYTPDAGGQLVASTVTGTVQGGISAKIVADPGAVSSSIGLSVNTTWANVVAHFNGIISAAGGIELKNAGTSLGIFQKLNLLAGLSATDAGGGQADITANAGSGGGNGGTKIAIDTTQIIVSDSGGYGDTPISVPITIPANTLGTNNAIRFKILVSAAGLSNNGLIIKVKFGSQTIITSNIQPSGYITNPCEFVGYIVADADTQKQKAQLFVSGQSTVQTDTFIDGYGTGTVDTTIDNDLVVTLASTVGAPSSIVTEGIIVEGIVSGPLPISVYVAKPVAQYLNPGTTPLSSNTQMYVGLVNIPQQITLTQLSVYINSHTTPGTFDYVIYSEDGQTQLLSETSGTIAGGGVVDTTTVPSLTLPAGNYYIGVHGNGASNFGLRASTVDTTPLDPTGGPVLNGIVTITASTTPATIDPTTDITYNDNGLALVRFDS